MNSRIKKHDAPSRKSFKKQLRDAAIILCISIFGLFAIEVALRIIWPDKIEHIPLPSEIAYTFNPDYLISLKPNIKKTYERIEINGGEIIHWRTNHDSFRGLELKEQPNKRIIVYGDSSIQARFSTLENTFPYQLESYLNETGFKDIEVINAGIIGFGPDQSLIRFSKEADEYKPDLVIFHLFVDNDYGDLLRNRLFDLAPQGALKPTDYLATSDLGYANYFQKLATSLLITKAANKVTRLMTEQNKLTVESESSLEQLKLKAKLEYEAYRASKERSLSLFGDHYNIDVALNPKSDSSKLQIRLMNGVLREAKQLADSKDIRFLVLIQPSSRDISTNMEFNFIDLEGKENYKRSNLTDAAFSICQDNEIPAVNLYDIFMDNNPDSLYFYGWNDHWNDLGQSIAAKAVGAFIVQEKLLNE